MLELLNGSDSDCSDKSQIGDDDNGKLVKEIFIIFIYILNVLLYLI